MGAPYIYIYDINHLRVKYFIWGDLRLLGVINAKVAGMLKRVYWHRVPTLAH